MITQNNINDYKFIESEDILSCFKCDLFSKGECLVVEDANFDCVSFKGYFKKID